MKIVIVGAGFTGLQLAKLLVNERNDVVLIDNSEDRTKYASNSIDCSVLNADGNSLATLEMAGISKADALVCVTESDEVNMVTCSLVDAVYPNVLKIARVRNYSYYVNRDSVKKAQEDKIKKLLKPQVPKLPPMPKAFSKFLKESEHGEENREDNKTENAELENKMSSSSVASLDNALKTSVSSENSSEKSQTVVEKSRPIYGIDYMIHPDVEAAAAIVRAVENGAVGDVISFDDSSLQIARVPIMEGSAFDGHKLMDLRTITDIRMLVAYFEENGFTRLPDGNTVMMSGCTLGVLATKEDLNSILELAGSKQKELKKIAVFGAGKIGTLVVSKIIEPHQSSVLRKLSDKMLRRNQDIVIVENDEALAASASEKFPSVRVFRADPTDENFLIDEGINEFDLAICASRNHEMNMILSAFLESIGVKQAISLVSSSSFSSIAQKLGIDVAIPLRDVIVDSIMSHLRGSVVKGIHTINEGNLEIIECKVAEGSVVAGKAIKEIAQSGKFLVLLCRKENEEHYSIVNGNTVLDADCQVVLIVLSELSSKVLEIFGNQSGTEKKDS